ncbi:MAG TPA: META domain-containing protein [Gemmatimonadales bacterium]|nr:META domain-containing protein [Gemmatimonadales bacterium]
MPLTVMLGLVMAGWLAGCTQRSPAPDGTNLPGTAWRLEDLGGAGVVDRVEATLEFPEPGKVAGKGSCNRFFGSVEISGASISFGPMGSTRMACVEAVMNQEAKYLEALQAAERYEIEGTVLLIHARSLDRPLRFVRSDSPRETPPAGAWRAIGTEPFWAMHIDSSGLRFTTPDDLQGIRWPPLTPVVTGDTMHWTGETERAPVGVGIWPARCSDGMSDRVWPYAAVVRVAGTTYRGCAESAAESQGADAVAGSWQVVAHRAPGIAAMSGNEADAWIGRTAGFSREQARFGTQQCSWPSYETRTIGDGGAFAGEFGVPPAAVGLNAPVRLVEVRCDGPWERPGSRLFVKGPNEMLALWDGVFFELRPE